MILSSHSPDTGHEVTGSTVSRDIHVALESFSSKLWEQTQWTIPYTLFSVFRHLLFCRQGCSVFSVLKYISILLCTILFGCHYFTSNDHIIKSKETFSVLVVPDPDHFLLKPPSRPLVTPHFPCSPQLSLRVSLPFPIPIQLFHDEIFSQGPVLSPLLFFSPVFSDTVIHPHICS